jgi:hypothetical protein
MSVVSCQRKQSSQSPAILFEDGTDSAFTDPDYRSLSPDSSENTVSQIIRRRGTVPIFYSVTPATPELLQLL